MSNWNMSCALLALVMACICYIVGIVSALVHGDFAKGAFFLIAARWMESDYDSRMAKARAALKGGQS